MSCFWIYLRNYIFFFFLISWPFPEALSLSLPSMFLPPASLVTWCCQCPWCSWHLCWGSQNGRCYCHIQDEIAWGLPPTTTDARFPVAAGAAASRRPGLQALPPGVLPGDLGLRAQLPQPWGWDQHYCLCCSPGSTSSMWKICSASDVQLCVSLVSWCVG